jgi:hypothetical protein
VVVRVENGRECPLKVDEDLGDFWHGEETLAEARERRGGVGLVWRERGGWL